MFCLIQFNLTYSPLYIWNHHYKGNKFISFSKSQCIDFVRLTLLHSFHKRRSCSTHPKGILYLCAFMPKGIGTRVLRGKVVRVHIWSCHNHTYVNNTLVTPFTSSNQCLLTKLYYSLNNLCIICLIEVGKIPIAYS